jgi:putative restriction endonuclease
MKTKETLKHYITAFLKLNVNRSGGHFSPHKPAMLLAILELAEAGLLIENRIYYNQQLLERFKMFFQAVQQTGDFCNPYFPFFHLRNEQFWHLQPIAGKEAVVKALSTIRGPSQINDNIEYAFLDDDLFNLVNSKDKRELLRLALITKWFPKDREVIKTVCAQEIKITSYEKVLRERVESRVMDKKAANYSVKIRDSAFSRIVREAYDYRCAASGWRVILPDGAVLVEAAHLIPFSETQDDDPRNGIALAPNFHWALDQHILAPGPDLKWHISPTLDNRNRDHQELIAIDKKPLLLPQNKKYYPRMDALEWQFQHLQ